MSGAFIINGLRTFIGLKNKAYKNIPTEDLAGEVLRALKLQNSALGINAQMVIAGNCTSGGGYLARLAFQFIPESFCENSMIMSTDETCRKKWIHCKRFNCTRCGKSQKCCEIHRSDKSPYATCSWT